MTRHASSYWMNSKPHINILFSQYFHHFSDWVLSFSNSQAISWYNNYILWIYDCVYRVFNVDFGVCSGYLHFLASSYNISYHYYLLYTIVTLVTITTIIIIITTFIWLENEAFQVVFKFPVNIILKCFKNLNTKPN